MEGPRRPPEEGEAAAPTPAPPPPSIDPSPSSAIEFAVQPPPEAQVPAHSSRSTGDLHDPGTAPDSGTGWLVIGAYVLPMAAYGGVYLSWGLTWSERFHRPTILATSVALSGLAIFGAASIGIGAYRQRELRRWARAHRVIALPQGRGLLVAATLALLSPAALISSGVNIYNNGSEAIGTSVIVLSAALLASAPVMFAIGGKRARKLTQTGGWRRPGAGATSRLELSPSLAPLRGGLGLGLGMRF